ncbi:TPA: hypothetical protein ACF1JQ_001431 [Streptococcus pyogenes]|uniref:hypothetical protein n=1 Tax=Streptococcus pyogenes TaxID=1314 RepID=UPI000DA34211|nr:hypothetical protein [Streptococcus pyogenes]HER4512196.1 hypothetical protein [Streptococcus pyogenes NGAS729]HER4517316.1 hypothetical protein [Streptococcus pyogenes NGAS732]NSX62201.1 hypothetical protein [Streptococcus pyogenes]NSX75777.1 hypothetical protein [Streptococcus pyogenes]NTS47454.1 hypothetical protein [Streptococcus pyogenes]
MKKKLVMIAALCLSMCAASVRADGNDEKILSSNQEMQKIKFELDGEQQKIYDEESNTYIGIDPFFTGDDELTVRMPQGWSVRLYRQNEADQNGYGALVDMDYLCQEVILYKEYPNDRAPYDVKEVRFRDGYRLNYPGGTYKLPLFKPLTEEEKQEVNKYHEGLKQSDEKPKICPVKKSREKIALRKGEKLTFVFGDSGNWEAGTLVYKDSETIKTEKAKDEEKRRRKEQEVQDTQAEVTVSESTDPLNESAANSQNQNGTEQQSTVDNQSERNSTDQAEIRNSNGKTGISSTDWRTRLSNVWSTFIKYINPVNWFTWS